MLAEYTGALVMTIWFKLMQTGFSFGHAPEPVGDYGPVNWHTPVATAFATVAMVLMIASLVYAIVGLKQGRHPWRPLVLSLFAFGCQILAALATAIEYCVYFKLLQVDDPSGYNYVGNVAEAAEDVLHKIFVGAIMVMCGGLLSMVLSWRRKRYQSAGAGSPSSSGSTPGEQPA